jgi:mRNA-degrading endonuclease RelE of RelBE toxin-antitoxin system
MTPPSWTDWATPSEFRIRVAPAAAEKLSPLPPETQSRLRQMLQDIAELADLVPPSVARSWRASEQGPQLLQLRLGKVDVRYSIAEDDRTLTIEHVIVPEEEEKMGQTA